MAGERTHLRHDRTRIFARALADYMATSEVSKRTVVRNSKYEHRPRGSRLLHLAALICCFALPPPATGQSSFDDAVRWCVRGDHDITLAMQAQGCTWLIRSPSTGTDELSVALNNRGNARRDLGDLLAAMEDYNIAIQLDPQRAEIPLNGRGNLYRAVGNLQAALADYDAALQLNPRYAVALANRCLTRTRLGGREAARPDCDGAVAAAGADDGWPFAVRAAVALLAGDPGAAEPDLEEAVRRSPGSGSILYLRGVLRGRQGDGTAAASDLAAAQHRTPRVEEIILEMFGRSINIR